MSAARENFGRNKLILVRLVEAFAVDLKPHGGHIPGGRFCMAAIVFRIRCWSGVRTCMRQDT